MKASENGRLEVVKALAGEYGADVNITDSVSCVHQPELRLLLGGVWLVCTANLCITSAMMVEGLGVSTVFVDYTHAAVWLRGLEFVSHSSAVCQ